jgi:glycosyltransferase involved in cell wall biosynthesis
MKSCLFVFSHPAPYKVHLFNGMAKFLDLTVVFQRYLGSYSRQQYLKPESYEFRHFFLDGVNIGQENHLSLSLIKHLKKHRYDYIVMNGYSSLTEITTILYLQRKKIPYFLYINGGFVREKAGWKFRLKRKLISGAIGFFSPTPLVDDYLVHYGANKDRIYHYPYSTIFAHEVLDRPLDALSKQALRKTIGLPIEGQICIAIGQFIPRKNFDALIKAWRHVPKYYQLIIVGDGPETAIYKKLIKKFKLDNIILKPFQPKNLLLSMLRASDGFILLSKEDIYGHVVNEALSQGIPVLTSDRVISGKVLIEPDQNGVLISLDNLKDLPKYIDQLVTKMNPERCLFVARNYTIETMVKSHQDLFSKLTQDHA